MICVATVGCTATPPPSLLYAAHSALSPYRECTGAKLLVASSPGNRTHKTAAQVAAAVLLGVMKSSSIMRTPPPNALKNTCIYDAVNKQHNTHNYTLERVR